jgi:hypothetical protein
MFLPHLAQFLPLTNPLGMGAGDLIELALAALLVASRAGVAPMVGAICDPLGAKAGLVHAAAGRAAGGIAAVAAPAPSRARAGYL